MPESERRATSEAREAWPSNLSASMPVRMSAVALAREVGKVAGEEEYDILVEREWRKECAWRWGYDHRQETGWERQRTECLGTEVQSAQKVVKGARETRERQ